MTPISLIARTMAAAGLALVAVASLGLGASAARASTGSGGAGAGGVAHANRPAASSQACAPGATCLTIPTSCPAGTTCPTVSVEPTTDLGSNQWVYLNLSNFPANSVAYIYFCDNASPLTDTSPPYCVLEGTPQFSYPSQQLPIGADGTGEMSFETVDDPNGNGDTALSGKIPGDSTAAGKNFFCGDAADPCSIDVDDWALLPQDPPPTNPAIPVPADTAVIPLGFAPPSNGCTKAAQVSTYSDFSIEWLLPHESQVACTDKQPAIAVNTATSTSLILPFLTGSSNVLFLDDPQSADVQAALAGAHYTVVPIAASAVVMGYNAGMRGALGMVPYNAFRLTPNEVAGLVTYAYQGPYNADMVPCRSGTCSAMAELNGVKSYVSADQYGVYIPSEASGVTETLTDWVCNAKNLPFKVKGKLLQDPNTAQTTMTTSINQSPWPITKCTTFDEFPPLKPLGTLFDLYADPEHQVVKGLRAFAPPAQFQGSPVAGFAPIDWGDARYYGLDAASLQNAAGQFVAPSPSSVQAEIAALPLSKAGYPVPDPTLVVKGGYPMSTVIDALVPDQPLPTAQAGAISALMNDLLDYTTSAQLPDGYVPLPAKLASEAHAALAKALAAENGKIASTTLATVNPASTTSGATVTYSAGVSATAGTPSGTVSFTVGPTTLCTAPLSSGTASCTASNAPVGADTVTARYGGSSKYTPSSGSVSLQVAAGGSTTGTTVPGGGVTGSTVPTTSLPSKTVPTTVPGKTHKQTGSGGSITIGDVTLSAAAARILLPVALIAGGGLVVSSLGLSVFGSLRRRRAGGLGSA